MSAANSISASLNETRQATGEQFRSLQTITGNSQEADLQLEDIARQSHRQQMVNLDFNRSMESHLDLAVVMVGGVQKVGEDVGAIFFELEKLRKEMDFFRSGKET